MGFITFQARRAIERIAERGYVLEPKRTANPRHGVDAFAVRFGTRARKIQTECTTDAHCAQAGVKSVGVLKIDTEGADLAVLRGATGMLSRGAIDFVYVEFNDLQPKPGTTGGALVPIDDLLRPHGLRFIATYNDYIVTEGEMFAVSNALFAHPPALS